MYWTQTILDFIAAIAWPLVAGVVIWRLWPVLRDVVTRIKSVKAGGAEVEIEEKEQAAARSLRGVEPEATTEPEEPADRAQERGEQPPSEDTEDASELRGLRLSRQDLEEIVTAFASAGYAMGTMGSFTSEPTPVIKWEGGRPRLDYWKGNRASSSSPDSRERARELEHSIEELEVKVQLAPLSKLASTRVGMTTGNPDIARLGILKQKLREIDPQSPWGL